MLIKIRHALPFPLALADESMWAVQRDGRQYRLAVLRGEGARILSYRGLDLSWMGPGPDPSENPADDDEEAIWYQTRPRRGEVTRRGRVVRVDPSNPRYMAGCIDTQPYTVLDVAFEEQFDTMAAVKAQRTRLAAEGFAVIRLFVNRYRLVSGFNHPFDPSTSDSPISEVYAAKDYSLDDDGYEGRFTTVARTLNWQSGEVTGLILEDLNAPRLQQLQEVLSNGEPVPAHLQLLLDAKDHTFHHKDHRTAVVLASAAFEVLVRQFLERECDTRGIEELPLEGDWPPARPVADALERASLLSETIEVFFRQLVGESVKTTNEYQAWRSHAYDLRNQVVHAGLMEVTEDDSKRAFEAVVAYANYLNRRLAESRP